MVETGLVPKAVACARVHVEEQEAVVGRGFRGAANHEAAASIPVVVQLTETSRAVVPECGTDLLHLAEFLAGCHCVWSSWYWEPVDELALLRIAEPQRKFGAGNGSP